MTGVGEPHDEVDAGWLPPGQREATGWPVRHYGRVPRHCEAEGWQVELSGALRSGGAVTLDVAALDALGRVDVVADLHCVTHFSVPGLRWSGVPTAAVLAAFPPAEDATHVMVWAEYGYGANLPIADLRRAHTVLATAVEGEPLPPERGGPVRLVVPHRYGWKGPKWVRGLEYLREDRRGFWEERGYHNHADPWLEQRYRYQEPHGPDAADGDSAG